MKATLILVALLCAGCMVEVDDRSCTQTQRERAQLEAQREIEILHIHAIDDRADVYKKAIGRNCVVNS